MAVSHWVITTKAYWRRSEARSVFRSMSKNICLAEGKYPQKRSCFRVVDEIEQFPIWPSIALGSGGSVSSHDALGCGGAPQEVQMR